jgi:hypothetical protein
VYDTSSISDIMTTVDNLLKMFNIFTRNYKIEPIKTAPLEDLKSIAGDTKIQIQWSPNPNGLQPDSYEIYRAAYVLKFVPNAKGDFIPGGLGEPGEYTLIGKVYPLLYPILFEDTKLVNNTKYSYKIVPYFLTLKQEEKYIDATPVATQFINDAIVDPACSNLNCEIDNNNMQKYSCKRNDNSFDKQTNPNGKLCLIGYNVCSQYTNKQCKYDNGTRCTSPDYTNSKSRSYDKSGNTIPVSNTSLYFHPYCIDGTNAQVCDGYVENKLYFNGTPPNWQALSAKQFLPVQLSPILDQTTSFINFMVSTTQKADIAINIFGNELSTVASSLKSSLSDIRDMIVSVNEIFTTPLPFMYQLEIPTQYGGIDSLISQLNAAQNGPKPNKDAYTVGFALVFGAKEQEVVDAAYNLFKSIF